jgi:hypothetical protein
VVSPVAPSNLTFCTLPHITCRSCPLDPDSLVPVAQLGSLRSLVLGGVAGGPMQDPLMGLLRSAVQGCLLKIQVGDVASESSQVAVLRLGWAQQHITLQTSGPRFSNQNTVKCMVKVMQLHASAAYAFPDFPSCCHQ